MKKREKRIDLLLANNGIFGMVLIIPIIIQVQAKQLFKRKKTKKR